MGGGGLSKVGTHPSWIQPQLGGVLPVGQFQVPRGGAGRLADEPPPSLGCSSDLPRARLGGTVLHSPDPHSLRFCRSELWQPLLKGPMDPARASLSQGGDHLLSQCFRDHL